MVLKSFGFGVYSASMFYDPEITKSLCVNASTLSKMKTERIKNSFVLIGLEAAKLGLDSSEKN